MHKFYTHFYTINYLYVIILTSFYSSFTNGELKIEKLNIPDGFEISIYADGLDSPRQLAETDGGYIVVG